MSKTKDQVIDEQNAQQPDFVKELLEKGTATLTAKTREELAEKVSAIPADVKYAAGAVGQNYDAAEFILQIDLNK